MSVAWFLNLSVRKKSPGGLVSPEIAGPSSRVSDLVGLHWGTRIHLCDSFLGGVDAVGPGTMPGEPLDYIPRSSAMQEHL